METSFETVANGDISLNVAVLGQGPLILCIHGWPELWYSWRHQMSHFAELGYTVAAMDVRGYGGSSKPDEIAAYTLVELAGDAAAVIDQHRRWARHGSPVRRRSRPVRIRLARV